MRLLQGLGLAATFWIVWQPPIVALASCTFWIEIRGQVFDNRTCEPLSDALVCVDDFCDPPCWLGPELCGLCAFTDESGRFAVQRMCTTERGVLIANLRVTVRKPGYMPVTTSRVFSFVAPSPCLFDDAIFVVAYLGLLDVPVQGAGGGDLTQDGVHDVFDVVALVNHVFRGDGAPQPSHIADVNCDGWANLVDVVSLVEIAFRGADPATTRCSSCGP